MNDKITISTAELFRMFPDAESARTYLESRLWPHGARCPICGMGDRIGQHSPESRPAAAAPSDTPRTDAFVDAVPMPAEMTLDIALDNFDKVCDFAAELERESNRLREELTRYTRIQCEGDDKQNAAPEPAYISRSHAYANKIIAECEKAGEKGVFPYPEESPFFLALAFKAVAAKHDELERERDRLREELARYTRIQCEGGDTLGDTLDEREKRMEVEAELLNLREELQVARQRALTEAAEICRAQSADATNTSLSVHAHNNALRLCAEAIERAATSPPSAP